VASGQASQTGVSRVPARTTDLASLGLYDLAVGAIF